MAEDSGFIFLDQGSFLVCKKHLFQEPAVWKNFERMRHIGFSRNIFSDKTVI